MRNIRKDEPPQMGWEPEIGFFRFTEAISGEDWRILVKWEEWFLSRGIKTLRKSLWRSGQEWFALFREDFSNDGVVKVLGESTDEIRGMLDLVGGKK